VKDVQSGLDAGADRLRRDHKPSAHYEDLVAVRRVRPIFCRITFLLSEIKNNPELQEILPKN
jgi:hypothetical protein